VSARFGFGDDKYPIRRVYCDPCSITTRKQATPFRSHETPTLHTLDSDDAMEYRKNIFITGCSQGGIGAALARAFHNRGHRVIASARDPTNTGGLQALGIDVIALDVCDARSIQEAFEKVRHLVGTRLDVLVNNAGIGELLVKSCHFPVSRVCSVFSRII
jgi:hypothetical protein